jgi:threonine/homoserine/homoserine lactone efflux protein
MIDKSNRPADVQQMAVDRIHWFFTAVFPQFVSIHGPAAVHPVVVVSLMMERRRFEKIVDSVFGVVLIALYTKLVLSHHP